MHPFIKPITITLLCGSFIAHAVTTRIGGGNAPNTNSNGITRMKEGVANQTESPKNARTSKASANIQSNPFPTNPTHHINPGPDSKIQVAVLLDVSNSMDGLIAQAKTQLWNIVSVMGRVKCNGEVPNIEIALYEYGRDGNNQKDGYVKQINAFTKDLDQVSQNLFNLTTNGGSEYCGHVIHKSINELQWDISPNNYKVIFIAGNEDFLQGNISFTQACNEAGSKDVIVNTIYCGDRMQGIREHWNLGSECGKGSYTNIDQDATLDDIATPYDSSLFLLNEQLNGTYLTYGVNGKEKLMAQGKVDKLNYNSNKSAAAKRVAVKSNKALYSNGAWDVVDAYEADSTMIARIDKKTLPDSLKTKSQKDLEKIVQAKTSERKNIQQEIQKVNTQREVFLAEERKKSTNQNKSTLETVIEKIIKEQAKRYNMIVE